MNFYKNKVIRLAGDSYHLLLLRLFCYLNKVKIRFVALLPAIIAIFMLSSCATISGEYYTMSIASDMPDVNVILNDSINYKVPASLPVAHSQSPLNIKVVENNTLLNDTVLKPRLSNTFWFGNYFLSMFAPIGWGIDLTNDSRFTYGKYIIIDTLGKIKSYQNNLFSAKYADLFYRKSQKGSFYGLIYLPWANQFYLQPENEPFYSNMGFWGIGGGFEYFYKNNKSFQLRSDVFMDFFLPFPAAVDFDESVPRKSGSAFNVNFTDNYTYKRFQFGYGLNYAQSVWNYYSGYTYLKDKSGEIKYIDEKENKEVIHRSLGFAGQVYYRFSNCFYLGIIYRPSFWEISPQKRLLYEHTISIDMLFKIGR